VAPIININWVPLALVSEMALIQGINAAESSPKIWRGDSPGATFLAVVGIYFSIIFMTFIITIGKYGDALSLEQAFMLAVMVLFLNVCQHFLSIDIDKCHWLIRKFDVNGACLL